MNGENRVKSKFSFASSLSDNLSYCALDCDHEQAFGDHSSIYSNPLSLIVIFFFDYWLKFRIHINKTIIKKMY